MQTSQRLMLYPTVGASIRECAKRYKFQGASSMCFPPLVLALFFRNVLKTSGESTIFNF